MHVAFETSELTAKDLQMLSILVGETATPNGAEVAAKAKQAVDVAEAAPAGPTEEELAAKEAAKKAALAKKAKAEAEAKAKAEAEAAAKVKAEEAAAAEAEPSLDDITADADEPEGPTMADAVAAATKLVSTGGAPKVKEALGAVGAKRVSEIPADKVAAFLDALQ